MDDKVCKLFHVTHLLIAYRIAPSRLYGIYLRNATLRVPTLYLPPSLFAASLSLSLLYRTSTTDKLRCGRGTSRARKVTAESSAPDRRGKKFISKVFLLSFLLSFLSSHPVPSPRVSSREKGTLFSLSSQRRRFKLSLAGYCLPLRFPLIPTPARARVAISLSFLFLPVFSSAQPMRSDRAPRLYPLPFPRPFLAARTLGFARFPRPRGR